jgi:hypothetical protein
MNQNCTTRPILPFITITTKFLSKHYNGTWHRDDWLSLFQFYRKTFLRNVDPKQPKNVQGEVHDFSGEVQKLSGEVQNDLRGGAHPPQNPALI